MINRALIRLKVVQLIYAYYQNEGKTTEVALKELDFSLQKAYDLYRLMLLLLVEIRRRAERVDAARKAKNYEWVAEMRPPTIVSWQITSF